jgi:protein SCO1/2
MDAMLMPFRVEDARELAGVGPGARVRFELAVTRNGSVARHVRITGQSELPAARGRIAIGEALPEFRLTDQMGRTVTPGDLRGKVVAIDFIYTRCPLPDVCPRLSANFAALQRRAGADLLLLSVTVDPDYDTPAVLAAYARRWSADPAKWRFLTGDVGPLAAALGQIYWADEGAIGNGIEPQVGLTDGPFDRTHLALIPDLHRYGARIGGRDRGHLVDRHALAVHVDDHRIEQMGAGAPSAQACKLLLQRIHGAAHPALELLHIDHISNMLCSEIHVSKMPSTEYAIACPRAIIVSRPDRSIHGKPA